MKYKTFKDNFLTLDIPEYLIHKYIGTNHFFKADRRRIKTPLIDSVAIDILPGEEHVSLLQNQMRVTKKIDWMGVEQRVLAVGPIHSLKNGFELLTVATNTITGYTDFTYHVIFNHLTFTIYLLIRGNKDEQHFITVSKDIANSMQFISSS